MINVVGEMLSSGTGLHLPQARTSTASCISEEGTARYER